MSEETKKTPQAEPAAEPKTAEQAAPEAAAEQAAPASETAEPKDAKKDGWFKKNRDLEAAKAKLEAAEQEAAQTKEKLLRMAAEYDNYRKRTAREADQKFNDGISFAVNQIIPILDTLEMAANAPTINQLYPQGFQLPRFGIYITRTKIGDVWYPSATGLGTRPTVNNDPSKVTCETFIPGFSGDLYGTDPVVEFHAYLSPSKKFDTLDELKACINHAAERAQAYFRAET